MVARLATFFASHSGPVFPDLAKIIWTITMNTASSLLNETSPAIPAGHLSGDGPADEPAEHPVLQPGALASILMTVLLLIAGAVLHLGGSDTEPVHVAGQSLRVLPIP